MTVAGLADALFPLVEQGERSAPDEDFFGWANAARKVRRQVASHHEADDPTSLAAGLAELKERVRARLEAVSLAERGGPARAAFLLETLVSLAPSPTRVYESYPRVEAEATELAVRFGLDLRSKSRAEHHLALVHHGDLGVRDREPWLLRAFFRLALSNPRAEALQRALLARSALYPDYSLWYAFFADDPVGTRALFARNDEHAVEARLAELLANDRAFERALNDKDQRHAGRARFIAGQWQGRGLDITRELAKSAALWVDLFGNVGSPDLADGLHLPATPSSLDTWDVDASSFAHVLPLVRDDAGLRLMDDAERDAYANQIERMPHARAALLDRTALEKAIGERRGPTLFTAAGCYLDSIGLGGQELRARALERGAKPARVGATKLAHAMLSVLREGDVLALFARPGIPSYAGLSFLALDVGEGRRARIRAMCHVDSSPARRERWQELP